MCSQFSVKQLHSLLQECIAKKNLTKGRNLQEIITKNGFQSNPFLGSHLIRLFAICGSLDEAFQVFQGLHPRTIFSWGIIILAHANLGKCHRAIQLFYQMQESNLYPNSYIFVSVLKACASISNSNQGMLVHSQVIITGCEEDVFVTNSLIDMYSKCKYLDNAVWVFEKAKTPTVTTWTAMITGYSLHEHTDEALKLFFQMEAGHEIPNDVTFICALGACTSSKFLEKGKLIHGYIRKSKYVADEAVCNALICMYFKCDSIEEACKVFEALPKRSVVTWNAMISGYSQHGHVDDVIELLHKMQLQGINPNVVTFSSAFTACSATYAIDKGRYIHSKLIMFGSEWDAFTETTLIDMYMQCGAIKDAYGVFTNLSGRGLVTWTAMISGLVQHHCNTQAIALFTHMQQEGVVPNDSTFVSVLQACSDTAAIEQGRLIHSLIISDGFGYNGFVGNALIDMYAKSGSPEDTRAMFNMLPHKDVIAYNTMMYGYAEEGLNEKALQLYSEMQRDGKQSTTVTFVTALKACSDITTLKWGQLINHQIFEVGVESNTIVANTLIDMYGRSESLEDALAVFTKLDSPNEFSWGAIIAGSVQCGNYESALYFLTEMQHRGFLLNEVLFVCLLSSLCHLGRISEAFEHFNTMEQKYRIARVLDHYCCIVDLLGRVGCINEAEDLMQTIPFEANPMGWSSILSNCKTYGNVKVGNRCFDSVVTQDHRHASGYVLMSNVLISANQQEDVEKVQCLRASAHAWKKPGKALIQVGNQIHDFCVGDDNNDLQSILKMLYKRLRINAYMPQVDFI